MARDLQAFIAEKVAAGWSDEEIYDYFVARYTERVRLDSRFQGWGVALWLTPLALAAVGAAAILNRRRRRRGEDDGDAAPVPAGSGAEAT